MSNSSTAIVYAVLGCFFSALALILMKLAHNRNIKLKEKGISKSLLCNIFWIAGFLNLLLGCFFNIMAIAYGNVMMLACMSGLSIIFNTILAVTLLDEKLLVRRVIGMAFVIVGSVLFLIFAKNDDKEYTAGELIALYGRYPSLFYIFISLSSVAMVYHFDNKIKLYIITYFKYCKAEIIYN